MAMLNRKRESRRLVLYITIRILQKSNIIAIFNLLTKYDYWVKCFDYMHLLAIFFYLIKINLRFSFFSDKHCHVEILPYYLYIS